MYEIWGWILGGKIFMIIEYFSGDSLIPDITNFIQYSPYKDGRLSEKIKKEKLEPDIKEYLLYTLDPEYDSTLTPDIVGCQIVTGQPLKNIEESFEALLKEGKIPFYQRPYNSELEMSGVSEEAFIVEHNHIPDKIHQLRVNAGYGHMMELIIKSGGITEKYLAVYKQEVLDKISNYHPYLPRIISDYYKTINHASKSKRKNIYGKETFWKSSLGKDNPIKLNNVVILLPLKHIGVEDELLVSSVPKNILEYKEVKQKYPLRLECPGYLFTPDSKPTLVNKENPESLLTAGKKTLITPVDKAIISATNAINLLAEYRNNSESKNLIVRRSPRTKKLIEKYISEVKIVNNTNYMHL